MSTLEEYIASEEDLLKEAALALPHEFSKCTYNLGHIRQAVYLCLTCPEKRGICSACSVACHTNHEQLELFPKRHFRCDCPTTSVTHACTLHTRIEDENVENTYGQNFTGVFCRCSRPYDAKTEQETMIQCLMCEDWFHESCCNLRERPSSREQTPDLNGVSDQVDDDASDVSNDLPPALVTAADYEGFVCGTCASKNELLKRWAGTPGIMMVVRDSPEQPWRRLVGESEKIIDEDMAAIDDAPGIGTKRPLSRGSDSCPQPKRARGSTSEVCLAPPANSIAQGMLASLSAEKSSSLGTGDLFLMDGFRDRWCRCSSCNDRLNANPCLLQEEETYEPPDDPDSGLSLEELGLRALGRVPRDRVLDGIHAFNAMRNDLLQYLRPFAQEGKVVSEADVRSFFDSLQKDGSSKSGLDGRAHIG